jgi:diguanylate cyclase (GGDEF)-like protein
MNNMGYYTAIIIITVFAMFVMIMSAYSNSFLPKDRQRGFIVTFFLVILAALSEWLGVYLDGAPEAMRSIHIAVKCIEFSLTPAIPITCAWAICSYKGAKLAIIPTVINAFFEVLSARFGFIFFVDSANVYHRRGWYWIYIAAFFAGIVFLFIQSFKLSRRYQNRNRLVLAMILTFLVAGTGTQLIDRNIRIDWVTVAMASMIFFIYYSDLIEQMDALTSLLNRRSFDCSLGKDRRPAEFLFFDVDGFKEINDTYGHRFGDYCLETIGSALREVYSKNGLCYRYGGDEFCVILHKQPDAVDRLNSEFFAQMDKQRESELRIPRVSVGYTRFDPTKETIEDAMVRADEMMYKYKKRHKSPLAEP